MSHRQVRRQASSSAFKMNAKRVKYSDASTSQSITTNQKLPSSQNTRRSFSDDSGNHFSSADKELCGHSKDQKDLVKMPLVKLPRADLNVYKLERESHVRRHSAKNDRPFRKDASGKRNETSQSRSTSVRSPFEGNTGSSSKDLLKQPTNSGQIMLPSKRPLDLALGLKHLDASKASSPFSLTAQFHKVMESINNSESLTSVRRKKLSARKSTSSCSSVSFKAFPETGRLSSDKLAPHNVRNKDIDNSPSLSSSPRQVVAIDEEVSFSIPRKTMREPKQNRSTEPNPSGSISRQSEGVKPREEKVHQMAARKAYPYQINSKNERKSGKHKKVSPFIAARKSVPYSQNLRSQKYTNTRVDRRASTSAGYEISSSNGQTQKRPTAARKSYPAAVSAAKNSRQSVPSDKDNQERTTAARKSYPSPFNTRRGLQDTLPHGMASQERGVAARKSYPASIKTGIGSHNSGDKQSQERQTAARKSYPMAARKRYPSAQRGVRVSETSSSSDATSNKKQTMAARKTYPHSRTIFGKKYSGNSEGYSSGKLQHQESLQGRTGDSYENTNVTKGGNSLTLPVRKTGSYRSTKLDKQVLEPPKSVKSPSSLQVKARRSDSHGMALMREKTEESQKSTENRSPYDMEEGDREVSQKAGSKSSLDLLDTVSKCEAYIIDATEKTRKTITKTTSENLSSSHQSAGKTDLPHLTPTSRVSDTLVQKAARKSAPGPFRTRGKSTSYSMSDRGKAARKSHPYQEYKERGKYERWKRDRKSAAQEMTQESSPEMYGTKLRTGQCSVPLLDAARVVAISVGVHSKSEETSRLGYQREVEAEKGSEKAMLRERGGRMSGEKKGFTKAISCTESTEVNSRTSQRSRRAKTTKDSSVFDFDEEETTEEEKGKFHIVTLGYSPPKTAVSQVAIPRSKYARQSLQSHNSASHHKRKESSQMKQKSSRKEEKTLKANRQGNVSPTFGRKVSYESKPSVGCKLNDGWQVMSIGEVKHKKVSQKKKDSAQSEGSKKSQDVDSDDTGDVDLSFSMDGGCDDDKSDSEEAFGNTSSNKEALSNSDKKFPKDPKSEPDKSSSQDRNIFEMFKIPLSIKTSTTFPLVSLEKKSVLADDVLESGTNAIEEVSKQRITSSDPVVSESSMVAKDEREISDGSKDMVQKEDTKGTESGERKSIEMQKENWESDKDLSSKSEVKCSKEETLNEDVVSYQGEKVNEKGLTIDAVCSQEENVGEEDLTEDARSGQVEDVGDGATAEDAVGSQVEDVGQEGLTGDAVSLKVESVCKGADLTDDAKVSSSVASSSVKDVKELAYQSEEKSGVLPTSGRSKERKGNTVKDSPSQELPHRKATIKSDPEVVYTSLRRMTRSERERIKAAERNLEKVKGKELEVVITKMPEMTMDNNLHKTKKKEKTGTSLKEKSPGKSAGVREEMCGKEQLQNEKELQRTDEDESDILGEAIADFLDNKDADRIDLTQSSDGMSENNEEEINNRGKEVSVIQSKQNTKIVSESQRLEIVSIQEDENISTSLEENDTSGDTDDESNLIRNMKKSSIDLSEKESEKEEDDSRNIFAIFQKAEKEVMPSPSKEKNRNKNNFEELGKTMESCYQDDLIESKEDNATDPGKSSITGGSVETNADKKNIFQMLQKHIGGDRKTGSIKAPIVKMIKEPLKNVKDKRYEESHLTEPASTSETVINEVDKANNDSAAMEVADTVNENTVYEVEDKVGDNPPNGVPVTVDDDAAKGVAIEADDSSTKGVAVTVSETAGEGMEGDDSAPKGVAVTVDSAAKGVSVKAGDSTAKGVTADGRTAKGEVTADNNPAEGIATTVDDNALEEEEATVNQNAAEGIAVTADDNPAEGVALTVDVSTASGVAVSATEGVTVEADNSTAKGVAVTADDSATKGVTVDDSPAKEVSVKVDDSVAKEVAVTVDDNATKEVAVTVDSGIKGVEVTVDDSAAKGAAVTIDDSAIKGVAVTVDGSAADAVQADEASLETLSQESHSQPAQDFSSEQVILSADESEKVAVSNEIDSVTPLNSVSRRDSRGSIDFEDNQDEFSKTEILPQTQILKDVDKENQDQRDKGNKSANDNKADGCMNDMSADKVKTAGEKYTKDIYQGSKVGTDDDEYGADVTAPQNDVLSEPVKDVGAEPAKMLQTEIQPPVLQLFNANDEAGNKSAESSDESTCMPIIVSVSSVPNSDSFLNPSPLKVTQVQDTTQPEERSIPSLDSFGSGQITDSVVESSSANEVSQSLLTDQKGDTDFTESEVQDTSMEDSPVITTEPSGDGLIADSQNEEEVDFIDGISFMSFSTKEEILSYVNLRKLSKKGKSKKKSSAMTSIWAMSKKKKKPVKKTPPKPVHSIFPARPKDHSQKCIEEYEEKFLAELRKQKRNEILHPALLKRGVSIKRSLDYGIPLLIDLELLDIKLDEDIHRPEKWKNQSKINRAAKERAATRMMNESSIVAAEDFSSDEEVEDARAVEDLSRGKNDTNILNDEDKIFREDEDESMHPLGDQEGREQNNIVEEPPSTNMVAEVAKNENKSVAQEEVSTKRKAPGEVLAKEHAVFKPFEKPVTSQKSAFFSSELDSYLNKVEEEKRELLTSKSPKKKSKKPLKSRHMDKLNSAIQEISFSSLFKGKQRDSNVSSKAVDAEEKKSKPTTAEVGLGNDTDSLNSPNTFVSPSVRKTRIGTTILKKSTAGSTRFRGPLPTVKESPKKTKGITDLPPNTSVFYLVDGIAKKVPKRKRQSTFLDRLVSNVKKATEAEKKGPASFSQESQAQGQKMSDVDMSTISERTDDPALGICVSPNEVLPVRRSLGSEASKSVKHLGSTVEGGVQNLPSTSKQQITEEKNPLEYFKEDPQSHTYDDLPGETSSCGNDFCRLGCVCFSLHTKLDEIAPEHCRKLECMLECKCERFPSLRILRARKRPALFHQDGMVFYDEAGLLSEGGERKRRRLDTANPVTKSDPVQEKLTTKKAVKPSVTPDAVKQVDQKVEETEKATPFKPPIKLQRKEPGFARGRVYIAKHVRQAAKQEEQDQKDPGNKGTVPPVKVVRTADGYCVKPVTNANQTLGAAAEEAVDESFKMLKRVDRMLYLSQRYRQRQAAEQAKDSEQNQSVESTGDVSVVPTNLSNESSSNEANDAHNSSQSNIDAANQKPSSNIDNNQGQVAPTKEIQSDGNVSKGENKCDGVIRSGPGSAPQPLIQLGGAKKSSKEVNNILKASSNGQTLKDKPIDVEVLPEPSAGESRPPASSLNTSTSTSCLPGTHFAKPTQGVASSDLSNSVSQQPVVTEKRDLLSSSGQQVPGSQYVNPQFRQLQTSNSSPNTTPFPQRVTLIGGKIVQHQPQGMLLQQGHQGGQFISLPLQPPALDQSKQLPLVIGQSLLSSNQQQAVSPQLGRPSNNNVIMLPQNSSSVPIVTPGNSQLLRLPVAEGKTEKQLIFIPQGKPLGTPAAAVNKNSTNYQTLWLQTSTGKTPVILVPVQPKVPKQLSQPGFVLMPNCKGALSVADQLRMRKEKAEQKEKELIDCYGLKAFNCSQQGVVRPLRELAGYVTARRRNSMDPTPYLKKICMFIPNNHLMNPNKAFHLLLDVFSNCQWEHDKQCIFKTLFKMASKVRACENLTVNGYKIVRTRFLKHAQKAKSINVSSSVARNCTTKIRIIGLFESEFVISQVDSMGNIVNPKTFVEVPASVETFHSSGSSENRSMASQRGEAMLKKQGGFGGEKGSKEGCERRDGQVVRKKANILRTIRPAEQRTQVIHKPAVQAGYTSCPKSFTKSHGGGMVKPDTIKNPVGDSRQSPSGEVNENTLPLPECSGQLALKENQKVSPLVPAKQGGSSINGSVTGGEQKCVKNPGEEKFGQKRESNLQSSEAKVKMAIEAEIKKLTKSVLDQFSNGTKNKKEGNSEKLVEEGTIEEKEKKLDHVREGTDRQDTGACDISMEEAIATDSKNVTSCVNEGRETVKSGQIGEAKSANVVGEDKGSKEKSEIGSGSLQTTEGLKPGEVNKDSHVVKPGIIFHSKIENLIPSVKSPDGKLQKEDDVVQKDTEPETPLLSERSETLYLVEKEATESQEKRPNDDKSKDDDNHKDDNEIEMLTIDDGSDSGKKSKGTFLKQHDAGSSPSLVNLVGKLSNRLSDAVDGDKDKSKDCDDGEILNPLQEITGVQKILVVTDLSSENEKTIAASSQEKSKQVSKMDVSEEGRIDRTFISTSEETSKSKSTGDEKDKTGGNNDEGTEGEGKMATAIEDHTSDCIPIDEEKEESNDKEENNNREDNDSKEDKNKEDNETNSKQEKKEVLSQQQVADGNKPLYNFVTNLPNTVSEVSEERIKLGEKLPMASSDKQEDEVVLSSSSSEDEVTSSDSDSGSDSESADEEVDQPSKRHEWFEGATFCILQVNTLVEKCFSGSVPFTAKWPEGYLDKTECAEGKPNLKKIYRTPFIDGNLTGTGLAWPLKPKKKEVKFMSPDCLSNLYKQREEQKHAEKRLKARRLAHFKRESFKSLPPSQRLPKRDKVKSLEYCVVDKKQPQVSDEDVDILGIEDEEDYSTDDDSIYTDSSYEDEQRSKNEALFSLAVIPSFAGRFRAILEKRGAIATPPKGKTSPESAVSPVDRSEMQSPQVPEVRDQLFLKDTDFASSGDESYSSVDVEKCSDSESNKANDFKEKGKKNSNDTWYLSSNSQSLKSPPSKSKKRKANIQEKRKGSINEKESYLSLCVQYNESPSKKSDKDGDHYRDTPKHEIHIFKERQRRAQQRNKFLQLEALIFEAEDAPNKPKIAILKRALEVIKVEKIKAKALDEELSAQRFCNYTLRTKIKNLLKKNPHLGELMCNPVETPLVMENVAKTMEKCDSAPVPDKRPNEKKKNSAFKHLLPDPTQPEPFDVAQSAQKLLGAMKLCMARAADKKESICHWTIQSMLDSGNEKLPSYLRTKEHMRKPTINFESEHYIISQRIQQERAARWRRKKRAMRRRESRLRIGSFVNAKGSGGLVFTKGVSPFERKQTLAKSNGKTNEQEEEESDSIGPSLDSPASSLLDTIEDNQSSNNSPSSDENDRGDDDSGDDSDDDDVDSMDGSLVCIAEVDEPEKIGTSTKPSSEEEYSKKKKKSKRRNKSKKRKRSDSSSEDEDELSPFGPFVIDESLPSEGEDGWIDDEPQLGDGWEEDEGIDGSRIEANKLLTKNAVEKEVLGEVKVGGSEGGKVVSVNEPLLGDGWEEDEEVDGRSGEANKTEIKNTVQKEASGKAKVGGFEGGKVFSVNEGRTTSKEKDANSTKVVSKQNPTTSHMSDINVDVRKIIPCLQVEEKDDGTLDVVLQGEFTDERLDELFARPGVMDYLRKVAAQKKKTKANEKPSGSGK